MTSTRAAQILEQASSKRVLVIGDLMLDEFVWGKVARISPEAPVPVVEVTGESFYSLQAPVDARQHEEAKDSDLHRRVEGEMIYQDFCDFMDDDFNTGGAVGKLFDLVSSLNRLADTYQDFTNSAYRESVYYLDFKRGTVVLRELSRILGLFHEPVQGETPAGVASGKRKPRD